MGKLLKLTLVALVVIVIAFILIVVGVGTNGWDTISVTYSSIIGGYTVDTTYGLDVYRTTGLSSSDKSTGEAAYALCVISTLGAATALTVCVIDVVLQLLDKRNEKLTRILPLVTLAAALVGGIFGIIGSIIHIAWMGSKYQDNYNVASISGLKITFSPNFSFFLTIIGSIVLIVGGGLSFKSKKAGHIKPFN